MEKQTTWQSHGITLLVFTGIVVLCSIFFVLGMLVGRAQGQKPAAAGAGETAAKAEAKTPVETDWQDSPCYDSLKENEPCSFDPGPEPPKKAEPGVATNPRPPVPGVADKGVYYQVVAVRNSVEAEKLLQELRKKGFPASIPAPAERAAGGWYRVLVGPFNDPLKAQQVKKQLESLGYQPILKR